MASPHFAAVVAQGVLAGALAAARKAFDEVLRGLPDLVVLSYNEITRDTRIESVALVSG